MAAVFRALCRVPADRFPTAAAFAEALATAPRTPRVSSGTGTRRRTTRGTGPEKAAPVGVKTNDPFTAWSSSSRAALPCTDPA